MWWGQRRGGLGAQRRARRCAADGPPRRRCWRRHGSGPGTRCWTSPPAPAGPGSPPPRRWASPGRVVLTDVAPAMVEAAARRSRRAAAGLDTGLRRGPARRGRRELRRRHLPPRADVRGGARDAVREARRVLRDGGRYVAMTWDAREANPWLGLILDAVGEQFGVPFPPPGHPRAVLARRSGAADRRPATRAACATSRSSASPRRCARRRSSHGGISCRSWPGRWPSRCPGMEDDVRDAIRARALEYGAAAAQPGDDGIEMAGSVLIASGRR